VEEEKISAKYEKGVVAITLPRACETAVRPVFVPAVDIYETPAGISIRSDMPCVAVQDLEIARQNNQHTVTGPQSR
jgi:HSP20 family molecular chaperone IbpA